MKPHLILAALDEATRFPDTLVYPDNDLRSEGDGEARTVARINMADCHQDHLREPSALPQMEALLRRWIANGPTHLMDDYGHEFEQGYAKRQQVILRVLEGDRATIADLLDNARIRATSYYEEATNG